MITPRAVIRYGSLLVSSALFMCFLTYITPIWLLKYTCFVGSCMLTGSTSNKNFQNTLQKSLPNLMLILSEIMCGACIYLLKVSSLPYFIVNVGIICAMAMDISINLQYLYELDYLTDLTDRENKKENKTQEEKDCDENLMWFSCGYIMCTTSFVVYNAHKYIMIDPNSIQTYLSYTGFILPQLYNESLFTLVVGVLCGFSLFVGNYPVRYIK